MIRAVIFDFYGTLARWRDDHSPGYGSVLRDRGYHVDEHVLISYQGEWNGAEHDEHSTDRDTYEAWVRWRLGRLLESCDVPEGDRPRLIDALRGADQRPMMSYPDAPETLDALRQAGLAIAVCSNWGWDLDPFLERTELLTLVDVALTSARVGCRKPHPRIYHEALSQVGVEASEALFVGDSFVPDVIGPHDAGLQAVHLWRLDEQGEIEPPELPEPARRIHRLDELVAMVA